MVTHCSDDWVDEVEFAGRREQLGSGLDIFIGRTLLQRNELVMELNNTAKHANSHLGIMGKPGVGKTQFLLKILTDIRVSRISRRTSSISTTRAM